MVEDHHKVKKQFRKICNKVNQAIHEFDMISENDRVLVGLSGGKDSMILLEALADVKKHLPYSFDLMAIHVTAINVGYEMDTDYLQNICDDIAIPLHLEEIEVDLSVKPDKSPCFVCSWHRRKAIFAKSKELDCNKVALGHHKDDALETMLLNMIFHGSYSSLPQKLAMFEGRIELIRPLLMIPEEELSEYARLRSFQQQDKSCHYEDTTRRESVRDLINLIEKMNKGARKNMFRAMDNLYPEYLPRFKPEKSDHPQED
ncbi:MAG: tRNA 2-thiocytidine(32) synthetase TtcA [Bacteroidales bacterium]|nr:tRNA 2-thiocytidine(32) synthetase TtcA [Bacteroidales bacterium]